MLMPIKDLHGTTIHAKDGEVGKVVDVLFDDDHWTVRYLIVETGHWLASRKVLLSPMSFGMVDWQVPALHVNLTREQIENSPDVDTELPVSRQWEAKHYGYYGWPYYWGGMGAFGGMGVGAWGSYWYPGALLARPYGNAATVQQNEVDLDHEHDDTHLRSMSEVTGYGISATDGRLGQIEDFIVDDGTWKVRYLALDTRDWWPEKKVLLPPDWIEHVDWPSRSVKVDVTQDQVKNAPEWDRDKPIDGAFEDQLFRYYSREKPMMMDMPKKDDSVEKVCMF